MRPRDRYPRDRLPGRVDGVARLAQALASGRESLRTIAALGLGLAGANCAASELDCALGDASPAVRANSAWALGRIGGGRSLAPLRAAMADASRLVRPALAHETGTYVRG